MLRSNHGSFQVFLCLLFLDSKPDCICQDLLLKQCCQSISCSKFQVSMRPLPTKWFSDYQWSLLILDLFFLQGLVVDHKDRFAVLLVLLERFWNQIRHHQWTQSCDHECPWSYQFRTDHSRQDRSHELLDHLYLLFWIFGKRQTLQTLKNINDWQRSEYEIFLSHASKLLKVRLFQPKLQYMFLDFPFCQAYIDGLCHRVRQLVNHRNMVLKVYEDDLRLRPSQRFKTFFIPSEVLKVLNIQWLCLVLHHGWQADNIVDEVSKHIIVIDILR